MALQLLQRLYTHARQRGACVAIQEVTEAGQRCVSFAQLAGAVRAFASTIEQRVSPGEVVLICQPNIAECTIAFLATLHARAVGFLVNPSVSQPELEHAARATHATAQIVTRAAGRVVHDEHVRRLILSPAFVQERAVLSNRDQAPANHECSGLRLLTSGTTGEPRIAMRDGPSLDAVARNCATAIGLTPDDRVLGLVPLCHSYGVEHGLLAPTYAGCTVCLCRGFSISGVVDQLRSGITILPGVPSVFEMLAGLGGGDLAFPNLRCAYSAGSSLPMSVFESCLDKLQLRVGQLYGSSEVGSVTFNDPHKRDHDPMSVGRPMHGVVARIVDPETHRLDQPLPPGVEGELAIHAPSMLYGYVGQDEPPLCDGFFFTGDLARLDPGGGVTITGRIKLLIDVGAFKVNPFEVEAVLARCEGVRDCAVVATSVSETISRLRALVVPTDPNHPPSVEEIRQRVRAQLSAHKVPRVVDFVASLPKSPAGKLLRRQIAS